MNSLQQLLVALAADRLYGSLEMKFEAGKLVLLRKTETIKTVDSGLSGKPR